MSDIFLCYRRNGNPQTAWHLAHILNHKHKTFLDTHIRGGVSWEGQLKNEIENCVVFICLINENWLEKNGDGILRIDSEEDFVRQEIDLALKLKKKFLPVTVGKAAFPNKNELPDSLKEIAGIESMKLRPEPPGFDEDSAKILGRVSELIREEKGIIYCWRTIISRLITKNVEFYKILLVVIISITASSGATYYFTADDSRKLSCEKSCITPDEPKNQPADLYDRMMKEKRIKVGYRENLYPLSYEHRGEPKGFSQALCELIIHDIDEKIAIDSELVYPNEDRGKDRERLNAVKSGRVDIECGASSITPEREKVVSFIGMNIYGQTRFIYQSKARHNDKNGRRIDFLNKRVAAVIGTTNLSDAVKHCKSNHCKFTYISNYNELFDKLVKVPPDIDIAFSGDIFWAGFLAQHKGVKYKIHPDVPLGDDGRQKIEQYGIVIPKGSPRFYEEFNKHFHQLKQNKEKICKLYREWFIERDVAPFVEEIYKYRETEDIRPADDLRYLCNKN